MPPDRKTPEAAKGATPRTAGSRKASSNTLLALDFGTSFSKACVRRGKEFIPLDLGIAAGGQPGGTAQPNPYVLASTLFVEEGKFLFGPAAYNASLASQDGRSRFDSSKTLFNSDAPSLEDAVGEDIAPGDVRFSQRDLLLLYLGYFTAMAGKALARRGMDPRPPRRFTIPGWRLDRAARYAASLRDLLARAQVLADRFQDRWPGGIPVPQAREALDALWRLEAGQGELGEASRLIRESLHEATAAGACILNRRWRAQRLMIIIDIGAGTTDLAAFVLFRPHDDPSNDFSLTQIENTGVGVDQAGNALDEALLELALDKSLFDARRRRVAEKTLRRQIRESKEAIFRHPYYVDLKLDRRVVENVEKDELLESPRARTLKDTIERSFQAIVTTIGRDALKNYGNKVDVYVTGGGAALPFVEEILARPILVGGKPLPLHLTRHGDAPEWARESGAPWLPYFSQLAVAIGAAHENIPGEVGPYKRDGLAAHQRWKLVTNTWC